MKEIINITFQTGKTFQWIDLCEPTDSDLQTLAEEFNLHSFTVKDCLEPGHLPKFEKFDNYSFAIIRSFAPKTDQNPHTIQDLTTKVALFYSDNFLITIHRKTQSFLQKIKAKYQTPNHHCKHEFEIISTIILKSLDSFEESALQIVDEVDNYEELIFLKSYIQSFQEKIYYIKRKASVSKRVLFLTLEVINQMSLENNADSFHVQEIKDLYTKLITIYDEINEDLNNLMNINISLSSHKTNEVMKVLTVISVFFMPLTFIVGVYGMNFEFMPELHWKYSYLFSWVAMLSVCGGIFIWFKKNRWM